MHVVEITAEQTHDLRRRVLRSGTPDADVDWAGDDDVTTIHLGVIDAEGTIVAISSWLRTGDSVQIRGMATDPAMAGRGLGRRLLDAGIERARADGVEVIWANARVTALGFYERAGFVVEGPEFITQATALPHRRIRLPNP